MMYPTLRSAVLLALLSFVLTGCASVRPQTAVQDPVPVYIGDFGVHAGLFLPTPDGRYVEYLFGDWRYAVENKCQPHDAVVALAASPGSAFGRMYHDRIPGVDSPRLQRKPNSLQRVMCERVAVYDVIFRLDKRFNELVAKNGQPVRNPETGVDFVRDTGHYSIANNCNHLVAQSLREMGCDVSGVVVWSKFKVQTPTPGSASAPAASTAAGSGMKMEQAKGWAAGE
jgi:hypothetical protein